MEDSALGITLQSERAGVEVFSTDTALEGAPLGRKDEGERGDGGLHVRGAAGTRHLQAWTPALTDPQAEGSDVARTQNEATFEITRGRGSAPVRGLVRLPARVEIHDPEGRQERPA